MILVDRQAGPCMDRCMGQCMALCMGGATLNANQLPTTVVHE